MNAIDEEIDYATKAEILDLLNRRARGADRFDVALMHSCHPADATDNHGTFTGSMHGMIDGLEAVMREGPPCLSKNHIIANAPVHPARRRHLRRILSRRA